MVNKIKKPALECEQINLQGYFTMKKMKFEMMNEVIIQDMTFHNMQDLLENYYDMEVADEVMKSEPFGECIDEGTAFFWVEGDKIPAYRDCMEWVIEEVLQIETSDHFEEDEEYETVDYYYDAEQMQFMA